MDLTKTCISFVNFQDIEETFISILKKKNLNFCLSHSGGVTRIYINGSLNPTDYPEIDRNIVSIRYETVRQQADDPSDIVETLSHSLSGLVDM